MFIVTPTSIYIDLAICRYDDAFDLIIIKKAICIYGEAGGTPSILKKKVYRLKAK
jgi:hypothetical protein